MGDIIKIADMLAQASEANDINARRMATDGLRAEITRLREALAAANARADDMTARNRILRDRPDLGDRASSMDLLFAKLAARRAEAMAWRTWCGAEAETVVGEPLLWQDVVNARAAADAIDPPSQSPQS